MTGPIVVAHRARPEPRIGEPAPARANTVAAIASAAAQGADAVEIDVRVSRDGQLILGHDPVQWRGAGRWRRPYLVARSSRRAMAFLDGLDEAVEVALSLGLDVKLDVKASATLPAVAGWCRRGGVDLARVGLWCRSAPRIAGLPGRADFGEVALLSNRRDPVGYAAAAASCGAGAVSLHPRALSAGAVSAAHERGLVVYAWILDPDRHRGAVGLGVDGLVTDWVRQALAVRG